jgi:hypothetical protein
LSFIFAGFFTGRPGGCCLNLQGLPRRADLELDLVEID